MRPRVHPQLWRSREARQKPEDSSLLGSWLPLCKMTHVCNHFVTFMIRKRSITNGIFHRTRTNRFKICMETHNIPQTQTNIGFCHPSTWISHRHTHVPSLLNLPPTSQRGTAQGFWLPHLRLYCRHRATVMKPVWSWCKKRYRSVEQDRQPRDRPPDT